MCKKLVPLAAVFLICCVQAKGQGDPNLVGYWNFDDGTAADSSGNTNDGIFMGNAGLNNDPNWTFGQTGMSLDLNYQNRNTDYVEIAHSDSLNVTHELSILLWIRPDDIENWDGMVCKGTTKSPWALRFNEDSGLRFSVNQWYVLDDPADPNYAPGAVGEGDVQSVLDVNEVGDGAGVEWTFVGVICDTQSVRFVKNLEEQFMPVPLVFAESDEPLYLGVYLPAGISNSSQNIDYFNGLMDEVRIYNRALSRREVIAVSGLATRPFVPEPANGALGVSSGALTWGSIEGTEKVYLGLNAEALDLVSEDAAGTYTIDEIIPGRQYFWRVDVETADGLVTGDVWTFVLAGNVPSVPNPSDNTDFVDVEGVSLGWAPAFGATAYDVYLGLNPDNLELLDQVTQTSYEDTDRRLISETVHYWRIDTVKDGQVVAGPVWTFKTMPVFAIEDALVGWYKFELGEGITAVDWTRRGNEGFLVDTTKWIESGYAGGGIEFDGDGDYVQIPRVVEDDWTIMLWMRTDNLNQGGGGNRFRTNSSALIDGDFGSQLDNFAITFKSGNIVAGCTMPGVGAGASLISNGEISDSQWHHVGWTRNSTTGEMVLYIDGTLDIVGERTDDAWKGTKNSQDHIKIGAHDYSNTQGFFTGQLDEVKFFTRVLNEDEIKLEMRPDKRVAFSPEPVPGAVLQQEVPVTLVWTAGSGATAHNVYFGTSADDLQLVSSAQSTTEYDLGLLDPGPRYWQVGEIEADGDEVRGDVWNFVIAEYLIVDDFESYNNIDPPDAASNRIFDNWIDGFGITTNGALVGNDLPPYAEQGIVNSGMQSMPMVYDNSGTANYSETEVTFSSVQDWTRKGVTALSLRFRGHGASVGSFAESPAGTYTITATGSDIWGNADEFHFAYKELSDPGSIIAKVESVQNTHNWAKAGVMIRDTFDAGSAHAMTVVSPAQGIAFQRRSITDDISIGTTEPGLAAPYWVKVERDIGGFVTSSYSADGVSWTQLGSEAIAMDLPMYVGLALTSHDTDLAGEATFSNVQITGTVSPQWTSQDIGILSNDPEPMYVAIAGSGGTPATVYHPDIDATQTDTWTEWRIDLQAFADQGVDLTSIDRLSVGFGDKDNQQAGGSGKMFFDDVRLYPPTP
ncbi:MAG: LamG-like jellyroll fold domain-containing protein [Planctomycetota bacterium]|jgi:hypothetical protein